MGTATHIKQNALAQAISAAHLSARSWSIESAYDYCEKLARSHYENFPVGSALVPKALRKHFYSIYAFARTADDFADEGYEGDCTEQQRIQLLEQWRDLLKESDQGRAAHPVFVALARTRAEFNLPLALFEDLLSAFTQDVTVRRYSTFEEVMDYCRRSANPIGRLILMLFGHRDEQLHRWSDSICSGLQLANHWQDVGVDLAKDRIYIPAEDFARFDASYDDLRKTPANENLKQLMKYEVARARELFDAGKPLCLTVGKRLGLELRAVWLGGSRILDRIESNDYDVLTKRPVISSTDKLRMLFIATSKGLFQRYR